LDEFSVEDVRPQLQAYLNCLELCRALQKQTDKPDVREALDSLIDDLQELVASLAGHLRRGGVAPGGLQLDREGEARIREVLETRSLREQLLLVRGCLADLVAFFDKLPPAWSAGAPADQADPSAVDWLATLSAQTQRMLDGWDQHMREMKADPF
jgi:hypothetical protein